MTDTATLPHIPAAPPKRVRFGNVMATQPRAENDWYVDPPEATEALLRAERFSGLCWDPACGMGTIPTAMTAAGHKCIGTDLVDRGFGSGPAVHWDFLTPGGEHDVSNIVSNPPYKLAQPFVERALSIASHKVAMLLPLTFLEGTKRGRWLEQTPLARVHVFSWRISMPPGELLRAGTVKPEGGKKAFAWFVWEHGWRGPAHVRFLQKEAT